MSLPNRPLSSVNEEIWRFPNAYQSESASFQRLESDSIVFAAAKVQTCDQDLEAVTERLYSELIENTQGLSIYRIWNFVPNINDVPRNGLENYQAFCKGRAQAFQRVYQQDMEKFLPAASAVGTSENQLSVIYIAGHHACSHLENPLQTPAYQYPKDFGPRPPSFARATAMHTPQGIELFISGTSSIRGSQSIGTDISKQLEMTIENLKIIEAEFFRQHPQASTERSCKVRVYLRHAADFEYTREYLRAHYLRAQDSVVYIQADICRKELDVEIETTIAPF